MDGLFVCYNENMETFKPHAPWVRTFFFWTGIIATILYRAIIVLVDVDNSLLKGAWYVGTVGFIIYFAHRYQVASRRAKLVVEYKLAERVSQSKDFNDDEKSAMQYVFGTLLSSKEKWNYYCIFATSIIALVWGVFADFILK